MAGEPDDIISPPAALPPEEQFAKSLHVSSPHSDPDYVSSPPTDADYMTSPPSDGEYVSAPPNIHDSNLLNSNYSVGPPPTTPSTATYPRSDTSYAGSVPGNVSPAYPPNAPYGAPLGPEGQQPSPGVPPHGAPPHGAPPPYPYGQPPPYGAPPHGGYPPQALPPGQHYPPQYPAQQPYPSQQPSYAATPSQFQHQQTYGAPGHPPPGAYQPPRYGVPGPGAGPPPGYAGAPAGSPPPPGSNALKPHSSIMSSAGPVYHQPSLYSQTTQHSQPYHPGQLGGLYQGQSTYSAYSGANPAGAYYAHAPHPTSQPTEVKLEISAKGLRDRDVLGKSDPVAVVFEEVRLYGTGSLPNSPPPKQQWREIGRTESIKDDLNPHFKQHITVPYHFEELQNIRIGLWDIDRKNPALSLQDFLGDARTTLGDIVASGEWTSELRYPREQDNKKFFGGKRKLGTVTVRVHENSKTEKIAVNLELMGFKLSKMDLFGKSDPYVVITQLKGRSGARVHLYTSEIIKKTLNPVWRPIRILVDATKGGTTDDIKLEFRVVDKDNYSRDDEIGIALASVAEIETSPSLTLVSSKNRAKGKRKSSGTLKVKRCDSLRLPSMIEYLQGGTRLHFTVAIDLTISNGDPQNPQSLHFMDPVAPSNQYVKALSSIASILSSYAPPDGKFAAYGFGADIDSSGNASHCFPLGLGVDPYCDGLDGVLHAYNHALVSVGLSGPTNFSPIIAATTQVSQQRPQSQTEQNYDVLLILTDGVVSDFQLTIDRIIEASHKCPLSIIIIGVGYADFRKMEALDADDKRLTSVDGRRRAKRDIVQFVPFRDFEHKPPEQLASHVLRELPGNLIEYFTTRDTPLLPNPPPFLAGGL